MAASDENLIHDLVGAVRTQMLSAYTGNDHSQREAVKSAFDALRAALASAREEAERLREAAIVVALAVEIIGQRYRDDWSDFDGRTLKAELRDAVEPLNAALSPPDADRSATKEEP